MVEAPAGLHVNVEATRQDVIGANIELGQRSRFGMVAGSAALSLVGLNVFSGASLDLGLIYLVVFGVALVTGLYCVPFVWWAMRRRPDLLLGPIAVAVDGDGLMIRNAMAETRIAWPAYRQGTELEMGFLLRTGVTASLIPKRGMSPAELSSFRSRLRDHGLLRPLDSLVAMLPWVGLGIVLGLLPLILTTFARG